MCSKPSSSVSREAWAERRLLLERRRYRSYLRARLVRRMLRLLRWQVRTLSASGLPPARPYSFYPVVLTEIDLDFAKLPAAFDGYRLLHLSDLHFDRTPGIENTLLDLVAERPVDLVVFTGDYQDRFLSSGGIQRRVIGPMSSLMQGFRTTDGTVAILGNHDSVRMVPPLERLGIRVLCNENMTLSRRGAAISITGVDDVHSYYTDRASQALQQPIDGFKIALVHSAELHREAAARGYALYLAGHTHGGQICLPGGIPLVTNLRAKRRYASGLWRDGEMIGFTNRGAGTVGIPVRLNCPAEVALITLRKKAHAKSKNRKENKIWAHGR